VSGARLDGKYPFFGSIATKSSERAIPACPASVAIPYAMSIGLRPGYFGGNYLGVEHESVRTERDPNADNFQVKNMGLQSDDDRPPGEPPRPAAAFDNSAAMSISPACWTPWTASTSEAYQLVTRERAREAFDLSARTQSFGDATAATRGGRARCWLGDWSKRGRRSSPATSAAGITTGICRKGWKTTSPDRPAGSRPVHRPRPNEDSTTRCSVVLCGEFSRTPRMNDGGNGGTAAEHGNAGSRPLGECLVLLLGGGGVRGGRSSAPPTDLGEVPQDRPLRPGDIHHTIFKVLGCRSELHFPDHAGRPIAAIDHGAVIDELF
jgi:hypothetical protein